MEEVRCPLLRRKWHFSEDFWGRIWAVLAFYEGLWNGLKWKSNSVIKQHHQLRKTPGWPSSLTLSQVDWKKLLLLSKNATSSLWNKLAHVVGALFSGHEHEPSFPFISWPCPVEMGISPPSRNRQLDKETLDLDFLSPRSFESKLHNLP